MIELFKNLYNNKNFPNILLYGDNLVGKKTLLKEILFYIYGTKENIDNNTLLVNCGMNKGNIKFIRENLKFFANTVTCKNFFKSIILLNADKLTIDAQSALRRCIEIYSNTKFFIILDNKYKIIKPILSRFSEIYINLDNSKIQEKKIQKNKIFNENNTLKNIINKLIIFKNTIKSLENINLSYNDYNDYFNIANYIYNKGIYANQLLHYIDKFILNKKAKYDFLFFFNIYKKEVKNEELLIFIIVYIYITQDNINYFDLYNN